MNKIKKPIYYQIAVDITVNIVKKKYKIGEKISGRSILASQYNVSPETIRRAVFILKEMDIVEINQGSGIIISSYENALQFMENIKDMDSMMTLKKNLLSIVEEKKRLDDDMIKSIIEIIDYTDRFKNINPFIPYEIEVNDNFSGKGKSIEELRFWNNTGATIIGIRRDKETIISPGPYNKLNVGDTIMIISNEESYRSAKSFLDC